MNCLAYPETASCRATSNESHKTADSSAQKLIEQWRGGSQLAAARLHELCLDHVRRVVRYHLNRRYFVRCDEEDAVQVAFMEVFRRLKEGNDMFESNEALVRWVRVIARNRTIKLIKFQSAEKRTQSRENRTNDSTSFQCLVDRHGRGAHKAQSSVGVSDLHERLGKLDEELRSIATMLHENLTQQEIADRLSCTTRTVRRRVLRIRKALAPVA